MTARTVRTQAELDAALADSSVDYIDVESSGGVWLYLSSADSATVHAYGSATVHAYGSATVHAYDSATVHAYDSATVHAFDSATVRAGKYVAVHLHSQRVTIKGGVVIDVTAIDKHDARSWCDWQGITVTKAGYVTVYKAVDANLRSGHGMTYSIGETVTDPKWAPTDTCGAGLHFGPTPMHAAAYHNGDTVRFLACRIKLDDAVGITGHPGDTAKIKAPACKVLHEVDIHGNRVDGAR